MCCSRSRERLANARQEAQRPGAEKAARQQELHKKLRVSQSSVSSLIPRPSPFCFVTAYMTFEPLFSLGVQGSCMRLKME